MKITQHLSTVFGSIVGTCALILAANSTLAANYTTTTTQAGGQNWTAAIWDVGDGNLVSPAAGHTYECAENGTPFGNSLANTRIRNPASAGVQTFPGDSLTLNANTEIRAKSAGAILNFPGTNGNPGLILNGGVLNAGDDTVFTITGIIKVAAKSYLVPADNGGGAIKPLRGFNISGQLTGNGTLVIYQAGTNVAQEISGTSNKFTGNLLVKAGWLKGSGYSSLGSGNITMDPLADVGADSSVTPAEGPAILELGYDIASPGTLTLANGGMMNLHQNCTFQAVVIEGTTLSKGPHPYAELAATFPYNFLPGGSGGITVGIAAPHFTTTVTQSSGQNWTGTIWAPGLVAPAAGATYECLSNGVPFGNNLANTRIRNPASAGVQTFPGDSLTLNANTEIRAKSVGAILNFPGVGGLPGLILRGGVLNAGDDTVFGLTGVVQIASTSYIVPADNGSGAIKPLRGFNISGQLTGNGTLVIYQAGTNVAQEISGISNTFTGDIQVKAGWLKGSGLNSLGSGNLLIDPKLPLTVDPSVTNLAQGPAWLEIGYDLQSSGKLTLQNGGQMILHQNCTFGKVSIEGVTLLKGTHTYAELAATFPASFAPGGSGSITALAGPVHLTTKVTQAGGTDWNATIWDPGDGSAAVSPISGNTYETLDNGTPFGSAVNNTRIRNPTAAGIQSFPGDVLTLNTNTEIRCKGAGAAILNFPGVAGKPGLVLNGGVLNAGDDAIFVITGKVQVAASSFIVPGDNGGGNVMPARGINIAGQLSGNGALVFWQAGTNVAQEISGSQNTYSGDLKVKAGWLKGSGANSLGTGNITIDPLLPLDVDPSVTPVEGPAQLEVMYDIATPGTLTLSNGGMMVLHQNCRFSAVRIEGTALSNGTHPYSELVASFPNNFAPDGSGSITVGAIVKTPPQLAQAGFVGTDFQAAFSSSAGTQYEVQYKDNLTAPAWTTLTTIAGDGSAKTFTDSAVKTKTNSRFYRVVIQ